MLNTACASPKGTYRNIHVKPHVPHCGAEHVLKAHCRKAQRHKNIFFNTAFAVRNMYISTVAVCGTCILRCLTCISAVSNHTCHFSEDEKSVPTTHGGTLDEFTKVLPFPDPTRGTSPLSAFAQVEVITDRRTTNWHIG
eukprot:gene3869-14388_t